MPQSQKIVLITTPIEKRWLVANQRANLYDSSVRQLSSSLGGKLCEGRGQEPEGREGGAMGAMKHGKEVCNCSTDLQRNAGDRSSLVIWTETLVLPAFTLFFVDSVVHRR